jgi:hypothetical protein
MREFVHVTAHMIINIDHVAVVESKDMGVEVHLTSGKPFTLYGAEADAFWENLQARMRTQ